MDGQRFDELTKTLATATPSRRRVVRAVLGGALGAAFGGAALKWTAAQDVSIEATDLICQNEPALCNEERRPAAECGTGCRCARAVNGDKKCVFVGNATCNNRERCRRNRDCAPGEVCVDIENCRDCAGRKPGRCFAKCPAQV